MRVEKRKRENEWERGRERERERKEYIYIYIYLQVPLHCLHAGLSVVGLSWLLVVLVRLAEDQLIVPEPERVPVEGHRVEVDVRVGALGLPGRAAIEVPDWQLWKVIPSLCLSFSLYAMHFLSFFLSFFLSALLSLEPGNTKGGSMTVLLTSCLTGLQ
jgi:hypothetical protein